MSIASVGLTLAVAVVVQPLVDRDVLEPSVQNEVDHALARCDVANPSGALPAGRALPFPTNGMSRTDLAIRLVSEQKSDGHWRVGTNDYTSVAVSVLEGL